jgi:hypothetical protein
MSIRKGQNANTTTSPNSAQIQLSKFQLQAERDQRQVDVLNECNHGCDEPAKACDEAEADNKTMIPFHQCGQKSNDDEQRGKQDAWWRQRDAESNDPRAAK